MTSRTMTIPVRQAADWLTRTYGEECRKLAVLFCREVDSYLTEGGVKRLAVRESVARTIAHHRPSVIIAHSLGSVVTYETLFAHPPRQEIDLLLTVGSPLAMPGVVFNRLSPAPTRGRGLRPPGVRRWINIADVGDIVAVPRGGLAAHFDGVERDIDTRISPWDFHTVRNYLADGTLRAAVSSPPG